MYSQRLQGQSQTPLSLHLESKREDAARDEKCVGDLLGAWEGRQEGTGNQREKETEPQPLTPDTGQLVPDTGYKFASPLPHTDL